MSETVIEPPKEQPKAETMSGFDRLSQDPAYIFGEHKPEAKAIETTPQVTATEETEKLEQVETTAPVIETEKKPEETQAVEKPIEVATTEDVGFEESATANSAEEGSWKSLIESLGYNVPENFTEEKGQEIFVNLKEAEIESKLEEVRNYRELEIFSALPEPVQGEAKLVFELLKTGQTLEQINAPIEQIKAWKGMPKEELIRKNLEGIPGYTQEMIDHKMEQIVANNHVDVEHNILMAEINQMEQQINLQKQQQIQTYTAQQNQIREQKRQQEFNSFKAALDKVPTFMDKKLSDENKASIINEYNNGYAQNILRNPEKLAKFMLYDKYGEQGVKYLQSRAIEKATLEKAKSEHNIPPVITAGGNRVETTTTSKNGIDRLGSDPRFA